MRREGRLAPHPHALGLGAFAAFARARADQLALELGQPAKDGQHQAAMRRGGVGPCVAQGSESGPLAGDRRKGVEKVTGRAGQPVESRDGHHVARAERVEQPAQLGAVGLGPARHLLEHLPAPCGLQRGHLCRHALAVRRDSRIAIHHAAILHPISAPEKPLRINALGLEQNS